MTGIDRSEVMLARAEARKASLPRSIAALLDFAQGDATTVRTGKRYDAVIALFHVMSYQTTNADLDAVFDTAATHLPPGGIFLFDYWYGPAVLTQRPEVRERHFEDDQIAVRRIAEPTMHFNENVVDVAYTMLIEQKATGRVEEVREQHRMRYLFLPELVRCAGDSFRALASHAWMTTEALDASVWAGLSVYQRTSS